MFEKEVCVAPVESSANGILVVAQLRDYCIKKLRRQFENGKIVNFKAEKGTDAFRKIMEKAEGDKDRIAELGIGINYGMKPIGWSVYDKKALGTAHIAIGNNIHLGGVNKASIHIDFVLHNPTIKANDKIIWTRENHPNRQTLFIHINNTSMKRKQHTLQT